MKTGNPRMINESTTVTIQNRICHIYRYGKTEINTHRIPVFYWGTGAAGRESVEKIASCLDKYMSTEQMPADGFILAAYESENWNDDFSPWEAPAVFGRENFGGKAGATLGWLVQHYIPYVEAKTSKTARFSVGYSLAGLFSLWVYCECDMFAGAVSCSGSLWYEGWLDYVRKKGTAVCGNGTRYLYLSLGDREEKTKNRLMATVGDNTRKVYTMLCEDRKNVKGVLEWNQGGHFTEADLRVVRGICWILKHFDV